MNARQLEILQHSLGVDEFGAGEDVSQSLLRGRL